MSINISCTGERGRVHFDKQCGQRLQHAAQRQDGDLLPRRDVEVFVPPLQRRRKPHGPEQVGVQHRSPPPPYQNRTVELCVKT